MFHRELYKKAEEKKMQTKKMQTKKNADKKKCRRKIHSAEKKKKKNQEKSKKEAPFPSFSGVCLTHQKKNSSFLN